MSAAGFDPFQGYAMGESANILRLLVSVYSRSKTRRGGVLSVLMVIILRHLSNNTDTLFASIKSHLWTAFQSFFYRQLTYESKKDGVEVIDAWTELHQEEVNSFPIIYKNIDQYTTIQYFPLVHNKFVQSVVDFAKKNRESKEPAQTITRCVRLEDVGRVPDEWFPSSLYPATNFVKLSNIIKKYLLACKLSKNNPTLGVLIDGEPGLGKTKSADFIGLSNIFTEVVKVDMTKFLELSFDKIMATVYHAKYLKGATLYLIDEIDKYIEFHIQKLWELEMTKPKTVSADNKEIQHSPTCSKEDFRRYRKTDFLNSLLRVLEKDGNRYPCIVIFCSNNFNTIFEDINATHFESLNKRFMRVTFVPCDKKEIADFLKYYNTTFKGSELHVDESLLDAAVLTLPDDVHLAFRTLTHISIRQSYNPFAIIDEIKRGDYISQPPTPRSDDGVDLPPAPETSLVSFTLQDQEHSPVSAETTPLETLTEPEIPEYKLTTKNWDQEPPVPTEREIISRLEKHEIDRGFSGLADNITREILEMLASVENARGKDNKLEAARSLLSYACMPEVIAFIKLHKKLCNTFKMKFDELIADSDEAKTALEPIKERFYNML